jgi:hypothetical protein
LKPWLYALGVALELPLLVLWMLGPGTSQGSRGPGSMAMVVPAIICAVLWFSGGFLHAVMLVIEAMRARRASSGVTRGAKILAATLLAWLAFTLYLSLR